MAWLAGVALLASAAACGGGGGGGEITQPTPTVTQMTLSPNTATVVAGQSASLVAQPKDASGNPVNGLAISWSSSDPNTASVSSVGVVTAIKPGQATITATVGTVSTTATVTVIAAVAAVAVTPPTSSLLIGQTTTLTSTLTDAGGVTITGRTVAWTSSNDAVASVSSAGVVTAKSIGSATITASVEGKSGTASVTVSTPIVTSVSVSSPGTVRIGATAQLTATATLNDGSMQPLTGSAVTWSSSDASKASVDGNGLVTGITAGSVTITAKATNNVSGSATLTVAPAAVPVLTSLTVAPSSVDVRAGAQTVTVSGVVSDGSGTGIKSVVVTATGHTISSTHADPTATCTASSVSTSGAWSCTLTIPRGAAAGQWPITSVVVTDNASHTTSYGATDVASLNGNAKFTVTSDEDVTAPILQDITVTRTDGTTLVNPVDVTAGPVTAIISAHYTDDLSGVASFTFTATSPANSSNTLTCKGTLVSGTPTDGVWRCSIVIPQNADKGFWTETFTATDAAFNQVSHTPNASIQVTHTP